MFQKLLLLFFIIGLLGCSIDYREANKEAVERLRTQLVENKFEEIYKQSEDRLKIYISKEEFVENLKIAVAEMKEFDESLNWKQDEKADEHRVHEVYSYKDASWRIMEKNERKLSITIWWNENFTFCDLTISGDFSNKPKTVVSRCSKS